MYKVSIIVPVYNVQDYITKCLESLINQTYKNTEIILVDDCSSDSTISVIDKFLSEIENKPDIKLIQQKINSGPSECRNVGMDNASGEFIYFSDSDDWISNDCIELLVESILKYKADVSVGGTICYLQEKKIEKNVFPTFFKGDIIESQDEIFISFAEHKWPIIPVNKLYRFSFIRNNKLQFKPQLLGEDELWTFQWAQKANIISFVHKNTYHYRLRSNSIISTRKKKNFEDMFYILGVIDEAYKKEKKPFKKILLKKYILYFKEMILMMQWHAMSNDEKYLHHNYSRLKKYTKLSFADFVSDKYTGTQKKKSILFHLPTFIGAPFFIWRFNR